MVHIWFIYASYRVFFCSTPQKKSSSQTGPPGRGSFVFHELRHPPPKAMGDFSPWPKILGFLGLETPSKKLPSSSLELGKMGGNVSHVCLTSGFLKLQKSYQRVMGFFVGFLQGKFLHLRLKGFWLLTKRATSEIRHRCWGLIQSLYWRNLRENQNTICTLVVSSFTTGRMKTGNQSCLLRHHKMSQNASSIIFFPKWSFETRSKSIWQFYSARF